MFCSLSENQLEEIAEYLDLQERRRLWITCKSLLSIAPDLDSKLTILRVQERDRLVLTGHAWVSNLVNLQSLILGEHASDDILQALGGGGDNKELVPNLKHISMIHSINVTDNGIQHLSLGESRSENLRSIDITFCRRTTYFGTISLRANLPNLEVLRRQPEWMDGRYETNFPNDGIHTYWADGSFLFERESLSCGFVSDIWSWNNIADVTFHVGKKLLYNDFVPPPSWPPWTKYCYQPGVSLLRLPKQVDGNGACLRAGLVAQHLQGLKPPPDICVFMGQHLLPLGESFFLDVNDGRLPADSDSEIRHTMVSRMRVYPLESLMPPKDVLERNVSFCQQMQDDEPMFFPGSFTVQMGEEILHQMLNR